MERSAIRGESQPRISSGLQIKKAPRTWRGAPPNPASALFSHLGLFVGVDHVTGLEIRRRQYGLRVHTTELIETIALDVVILDLEHARLGPFALRAERHFAHDGSDRMGA